MGALLLIGVLFVVIGVAVLIGGIIATVRQSRRSARNVSANGTVVDLVKRVFNPGSAGVYCPVVEFTTALGRPVRFESDFGTMPASHKVGQSVAVRYEPQDPQKAQLDSVTSNWFVPGCMIAMGLGFLGMGLAFLVMGLLILSSSRQ